MLGCEPVGEVDDREAARRKIHAVVLVELLVPIDPRSPVNAHDAGKRASRFGWPVDVEEVPLRVRTVDDVVIAHDAVGGRKPRVADVVALLERGTYALRTSQGTVIGR